MAQMFNAKTMAQQAILRSPLCYRLGTHVCGAARPSPKSTSGEFSSSSGKGKVGIASSAPPPSTSQSGASTSTGTTPRPLASSQTIKEAQSMAKLFLQTELSQIFVTGVSLILSTRSPTQEFPETITPDSRLKAAAILLRMGIHASSLCTVSNSAYSTILPEPSSSDAGLS